MQDGFFRRRAIAAVTTAAMLANGLGPGLAHAQGNPVAAMTKAEYEACQSSDEGAFKTAIEAVTTAALQRGLKGVDYRVLVADEWRKGDFDGVMAKRVDASIDEIRSESSWMKLLESLASKDAAQQLAQNAAERVYRSDDIKRAIELLATGVGRDIGKRIELATVDAAEPAMQCLKAFLGPRYGNAIAGVVSRDAGREFAIDPTKGSASVSTGQVLASSSEGIAGAVVLIVRRQLANMATRVSQRLVGAVLGRIVSVVAGGIGVVLIAKDIWELRHGVLPIIADEMKSPATREKVQDELAKSVSEQIGEHVREIGSKTAERVLEIWREFRRAHAKVVEISEKNADFRKFVDTVQPQNLVRLDEAVGLVLASEGEPAILRRLADGTLHEAVEKLPTGAFDVARELRSLDLAFKWQALAGEALPRVIEQEIFRRNKPEEFTKASLRRIMDLDDRLATTRLATLKGAVRDPLLELKDPELKKLARALPDGELESLSSYLTGLEKSAAQRLLSAVAMTPARMKIVAQPGVHEAIVSSQDQAAAIGVMLRADDVFNFLAFNEDIQLLRDGRISPRIILARYPVALSVFGGTALLVLAILWRLVFGRRPRIIVQAPKNG